MMQSLSSSRASAKRTSSQRRPFAPSAVPPAVRVRGEAHASAAISRRTAAAAFALLQPTAQSLSCSGLAAAGPVRNVMAAAAPSAAGASAIPAGSPANLDLLVVGPGVLGSVLAKNWLASVPGSTATGLTNTDRSHERLRSMGITPATRASLTAGRRYSFVAFSAPPSGSQDYEGDIKAALSLWDGTGSFVFTSSMSVCSVDDGGTVTDANCPLVARGAGPSTDKLLAAEDVAGGNVLRLVGLYHATRGAHTYFMKVVNVPRPAGYVVNLLHYEDAAGMAAAILRGDGSGPFRGRVFLGADGHPIRFDDMIEACFSTGVFPRVPVNFTGSLPEGGKSGLGKVVDASASLAALGGWAPKYASFQVFMAAGGKDFYNTSGIAF
ncbi:hypothetical protein GPECTOR_1g118 [Gonium pectorale]|uniref:NAD(P)-binding domain-containing protein n=1 Tax=Gonium pectorale TaxID=33097 RepID=A0A150H1X5_GONPE|nr:hypothetical protein GPECTOR_1g118 [Gonium pectorale]|eukprot:KXZ56139.1 hypothetical protein GPECTOR_1g118 [Gonium pectorale]